MDLFVFPSYREGFPNAPLEAAAAALPVLAFRATGTVDAVAHDVTGRLVEIGDEAGLAEGMLMYANNAALRREHGQAGQARVVREFSQTRVWEALASEYRRLVAQRA
jgi:glycosyltransferase involved in cell wall biosynthesis